MKICLTLRILAALAMAVAIFAEQPAEAAFYGLPRELKNQLETANFKLTLVPAVYEFSCADVVADCVIETMWASVDVVTEWPDGSADGR